jgi:DNA-binding transcriptional ArsR family regulator
MKKQYAHALPTAWVGISKIFTALGDERRQRILLLFQRGEKLNAGQIAAACPLAQSTVSHHLKVLREAGVLQCEKVGKEVYFWIEPQRLKTALQRVVRYLEQEVESK